MIVHSGLSLDLQRPTWSASIFLGFRIFFILVFLFLGSLSSIVIAYATEPIENAAAVPYFLMGEISERSHVRSYDFQNELQNELNSEINTPRSGSFSINSTDLDLSAGESSGGENSDDENIYEGSHVLLVKRSRNTGASGGLHSHAGQRVYQVDDSSESETEVGADVLHRRPPPVKPFFLVPVVRPIKPALVGLAAAYLLRKGDAWFLVRHCNPSRDLFGNSKGLPISEVILIFGDTHIASFWPNEVLYQEVLDQARACHNVSRQVLLGDTMNNVGGENGGPFLNVSNKLFKVFAKRLNRVLNCKPAPDTNNCFVLPGNHDLLKEVTERWRQAGYIDGNKPLCIGPISSYALNTQDAEVPKGTQVLMSLAHSPYDLPDYKISEVLANLSAVIRLAAHLHVRVENADGTTGQVVSTVDPVLAKLQAMQEGCGGLQNCTLGPGYGLMYIHEKQPGALGPAQNLSFTCPGADQIGAISFRDCSTSSYVGYTYLVSALASAAWAFKTNRLSWSSACAIAVLSAYGLWVFFPPESWSDLVSDSS